MAVLLPDPESDINPASTGENQMTMTPSDRLETFDAWLELYQKAARIKVTAGAEIDRLYALYLNDWSVRLVIKHDRARQEGGLQPIGPVVTLMAARIGEAYRRQRGAAQ